MGEAKLKNTRFIAFASERRLFMLTIAYIGNGKAPIGITYPLQLKLKASPSK